MFSRNNKKKMILLVSLIGVLVLSVGYAAITAVLNISANADLTANPNDFIVKFSSSTSSVIDGDVAPSYLSHDTIVAENAIIDNGSVGGVPMITNLYATIAEPGQSVSYTFYAHNVGKYDAYLTGVVFQPQASGSFITCDGGIDSSETMIKEACNSMSVTVRVESVTDTAIVTETSSTLTGITNHLLPRDKYEKVTVTLKYAENGKRVDGDFEVHFGDIYLSYGTSELAEAPSIPDAQYVCSLSNDVNSDGIADIGDIITCGTEKFYVIPQDTVNHPADDTTISMLAMYNLDVGTYLDTATSPDTKYTITEENTDTYGIQNEIAKALLPDSKLRYGVIPFSDTTYWLDGAGNLKKQYWYSDTEAYPAFVYDENSNIYPYIEAYETYLRKLGVNSAVATVLNPSVMNAEYDWIENTTFWSGVCYGNYTERISAGRTNIDPDAASQFASYKHSYANGIGVRPVVIIKKSELKSTTSSSGIPCALASLDGSIDIGDMVTCGTESFYVIPNDTTAHPESAGNGMVSMLAKQNIEVSSDKPVQVSNAGSTIFSDSNYWREAETDTFIYNNSASISTYVNAYKDTLVNIGLSDELTTTTLISYNQLISPELGCEGVLEQACFGSEWVYATNYWTGINDGEDGIWIVDTIASFTSVNYNDESDGGYGVRPVVILSEEQIQKS